MKTSLKTIEHLSRFIFMLLISLTFGMASSGAQERKEANTGKPCMDRSQISTQITPVDLYLSMHTCIREEKYDEALFLFGVGGTFGRFDGLRVTDHTAHQIAGNMAKIAISSHPKEKTEKAKEKFRQAFNDRAKRAKLCSEVELMGPPTYYPSYMINHGLHSQMRQVPEHNPPPIVRPFDPEKAWKEALNGYLMCDKIE